MWISEKITKYNTSKVAEKGSVTISDSQFEASATISQRGIENYAPYGFKSKAPVGEQALIMPSSDGQAVVGFLNDSSDIKSGEIVIKSQGGATIVLKNDGTIMLNSMVITKDGVIKK